MSPSLLFIRKRKCIWEHGTDTTAALRWSGPKLLADFFPCSAVGNSQSSWLPYGTMSANAPWLSLSRPSLALVIATRANSGAPVLHLFNHREAGVWCWNAPFNTFINLQGMRVHRVFRSNSNNHSQNKTQPRYSQSLFIPFLFYCYETPKLW